MVEVFVESEFAPLRTVVLAQSQLKAPDVMPGADVLAFLTEDMQANIGKFLGRDFGDVFPERQALWEAERTALERVLCDHGVEVLRPRLLTEAEKKAGGAGGYANFFVRDPFFTVGNVVIEASLRLAYRRMEVLPVRDVFRERVYPASCVYVAAPLPEVVDADDLTLGSGPFIEGGDTLVLGKHIFVGGSGLASSPEGARWLAKLMKPFGYTVEYVRLKPNILHLDCALSLIDEGLMIVCEQAFEGGIPERLSSWSRVTVNMEEATRLACNGLPIHPGLYVTDPAFGHVGDQIERHGVRVEYVDFSLTRMFGGSFRCSTQPLLRRR